MNLCLCGCGQETPLSTYSNKRDGFVKGKQRRYCVGHYLKRPRVDGRYPLKYHLGRVVNAHRLRAEKALGKPLPDGAIVHHADGSRNPDAPLVICQDQAYHLQLHARQRLVSLGADPFREYFCERCQTVKPLSEFIVDKRRWTGHGGTCQACRSARRKQLERGNVTSLRS